MNKDKRNQTFNFIFFSEYERYTFSVAYRERYYVLRRETSYACNIFLSLKAEVKSSDWSEK